MGIVSPIVVIVPSCPPCPCRPVGPTLPRVALSSSTLPSPSRCHGGLIVVVGPSSAHGGGAALSLLPVSTLRAVAHGGSWGAAVMSVWSCYFVVVVVVVLIPCVPISCSSFPVPLSLVVLPLSLPFPTYSPCEQGLAAVVVDGGVMGCCLVA